MYGMFDPETLRKQRHNPTGTFDFNQLGLKVPRGIEFVMSSNGLGVEWGEREDIDLNTCTVGTTGEVTGTDPDTGEDIITHTPTNVVPVKNALGFAV
jgi:hypothetical protein